MQITDTTGATVNGGYTPSGGVCAMGTNPSPARVFKHGGSLAVLLVKQVRDLLPWRHGDLVAIRVCGEKLVIERVPLEGMAKIRTGEVQPYAANLFEP